MHSSAAHRCKQTPEFDLQKITFHELSLKGKWSICYDDFNETLEYKITMTRVLSKNKEDCKKIRWRQSVLKILNFIQPGFLNKYSRLTHRLYNRWRNNGEKSHSELDAKCRNQNEIPTNIIMSRENPMECYGVWFNQVLNRQASIPSLRFSAWLATQFITYKTYQKPPTG